MNRFVVFIAVLLSLLFTLDRGLSFVMDQLFFRVMTGQLGSINYYLSKPPPQLVIMGSSRAVHQVDPDRFKLKAFNLGHGGMFMPFHTGLLRMMEQHQKLPPAILLQVDPYEFIGGPKVRDVQQLSYYYHHSDTLRQYINELSPLEKYKYWFDLYRYNGKCVSVAKEYLTSRKMTQGGNGYDPLPLNNRDSVNTLLFAKNGTADPLLPVNQLQFRYLNSFITICKRNHIRLICFTAPIYQPDETFRRGSIEVQALLMKNGIPYLNYSESPIPELQNHPSYWKGLTHLNQRGAEIFSGILADQVESLLDPEHP